MTTDQTTGRPKGQNSAPRPDTAGASLDDLYNSYAAQGYTLPERHLLKTETQLRGIRESSKLNIDILDTVGPYVKPGISTEDINRLVHDRTLELGGIPAPLNYKGYPKSVCTSVNHVVCHGIPSKRQILREGDIINIDVSTLYNGYFSDSSRMYPVGHITAKNQKLIRVAQECVALGIEQVRPWGFLGDIGQAVNDHATQNGFTVVREIGGHGIGLSFHEDPWVSYVSKKGTGPLLVPGLVFTIEPMINMGTAKVKQDKKDGWTVYTADSQPSAQWESMVLVTPDGCEILTY